MKKTLLAILLAFCSMANAQTPNFWHEKATGFADADKTLNSISIVNDTIWANEFDATTQDYTLKTFTRSTDAGETWTTGSIDLEPIPADGSSTGLGISSITAASATTAWISAYPDTAGTGGIWKTIDNGLHWTKQTTTEFSDPASFADFVHFWDANNGVALGDAVGDYFEIYTTNDGGTTWNLPVTSPTATGDASYFNRYAVSGDSIWVGTALGGILKSTDKGLNWTFLTAIPAGTDFTFDRFTFSDTNKGLLALENTQKIYKTVDGGTSWTEVIQAPSSPFKTNLTYIPSTSTVIATSESNPVGSYYSTDDGVTWTTIDSSFHGETAFLNDTYGFSAGLTTGTPTTTGGIFKFTGIPLKTASFDTNNQILAYPNPTSGLLHVNSKVSLVKEATVYDLLGKKVYSSKISPSTNVSLDLKSLQTGLYNLKVTSDTGNVENIKIIKN